MFYCYRRCNSMRELVEFCSGYYPTVSSWVRRRRSEGADYDTIMGQLLAIKAEVIRRHEDTEYPHDSTIAALATQRH